MKCLVRVGMKPLNVPAEMFAYIQYVQDICTHLQTIASQQQGQAGYQMKQRRNICKTLRTYAAYAEYHTREGTHRTLENFFRCFLNRVRNTSFIQFPYPNARGQRSLVQRSTFLRARNPSFSSSKTTRGHFTRPESQKAACMHDSRTPVCSALWSSVHKLRCASAAAPTNAPVQDTCAPDEV